MNSWLLISKKVQHIQVQVTTTTLWSTQPCARQTPTSGIIFKYPWPQIHISKNPHNPRIHKSTYPQVAPSHQANHSALHALRLKFWSWSKISLKQRPHSKLGVKYLHRWVHRKGLKRSWLGSRAWRLRKRIPRRYFLIAKQYYVFLLPL